MAESVRGETISLLTRQDLRRIKTKAMRQRVWFKTISRIERGIVDLTLRCVESIRSPVLASAVSNILNKILKTLRESFMKRAEKAGRKVAEKICVLAQRWGNESSSAWKYDEGFVKFLGVVILNS